MRVGVIILPEHRWADAAPVWRRAEELGFDHAWTYDHLTWRDFRNRAWFSAVPTLTAAASVTSRIRLGSMVASPNFRHPVPFAKELLTLDDLCRGRLTLGVGAGGTGWDATMLGHPPWSAKERTERFEEFVELTDLLLRQPAVSYTGRHYAADEARTHPGCVQSPRIPFAIAATGRRGLRLAAVHAQCWITNGARDGHEGVPAHRGAEIVSEQTARLEEACAAAGRDPASLPRMVVTGTELDAGLASVEAFRDTAGRYAEAGVTDLVVHWPRPEPPFAADLATFERIFS